MTNKTKPELLLIVEDEKKIAELLRDYLKTIFTKIEIISSGDLVMSSVKQNEPSFIILDVMLPGVDGFELCREIRATSSVPILFLTARVSEIDRILGFEFGADDYVQKPFSPREVVSRVKAILKRVEGGVSQSSVVISHNGLTLDVNRHSAMVDGKEISLTKTEFDILKILMKQPNFVFERGFLVQKVMGYDYAGYERNVDAHIKNLRNKISKATKREMIQSIYGVGYKFLDQE